MAKFEGYERRIKQIEACLNEYGFSSLDDCKALCDSKGIDVDAIVKGVQPIAFDNATWAYTLGVAIALKKGVTNAAEAAETIGIGLQAFCIPGSVAESRKVGLGHGNLAAMLLREETKCFCFLAGHESFAAAEGAIGIARTANKVRKEPLRVILNGLGKDAAYIISRINGFTYVQTDYDFYKNELIIVKEKAYSDGDKAKVRCYGANDVLEGVAIMQHENAASRQRCGRPRLLRPDRLDGQNARRRAVRRLVLRSGACRDDGLDRHGQQSHGRRYRRLRGRGGRSRKVRFPLPHS